MSTVDNKLVTGASIKKFKEYVDNRLEQAAPLTATDLQNGNVDNIKSNTIKVRNHVVGNNDGEIVICAGTEYGKGGAIALRGISRKVNGVVQDDAGTVYLEARDKNGNVINGSTLNEQGFTLARGNFLGNSTSATNADKLDGLHADDFCQIGAFNALNGIVSALASQVNGMLTNVHYARGVVGNSAVSTMSVLGNVTVFLFSNGKALLTFAGRFIDGTNANNYAFGINRDILRERNPNIPLITPMEGGTFIPMTMSSMLNTSLYGNGGVWYSNGNYWSPARLYTTTDIGGWDEKICSGHYVFGILHGTY